MVASLLSPLPAFVHAPLVFAVGAAGKMGSLSLAQGDAKPAMGGVSSLWELVLKGGWIMLPIGVCSLVALTIIVERLLVLRRASIAPASLVSDVAALRNDPARAAQRAAADPSPAGAVLSAVYSTAGRPREAREKAVSDAGRRQMARLRARVRLLSALPQTATMLGLLGTVFGMIRTFTVIAASGESLGKTERLAQGIYEAWTATAAGLVVAIPTLIAYHLVLGRIDAAAAQLDLLALNHLDGAVEAASVAPAVVPTPAAAHLTHEAPAPAVVAAPVHVVQQPLSIANGAPVSA